MLRKSPVLRRTRRGAKKIASSVSAMPTVKRARKAVRAMPSRNRKGITMMGVVRTVFKRKRR